MAIKQHHALVTVFLILIICVSLVNVRSVRADEGTPTEPPASTEVATQPPAEETPVPVESTPEPAESTPAPEEATATSIAEVLTQVPESTEVVVLDDQGDPVPLATQEAATIAEVIDPIWCPEGVLPGGVGSGCSSSFGTIGELLTDMISNTANYTQNGTIYFTATAGGSLSLTDSSLGAGVFDTLNDYNLTLQGGWNGNTTTPSLSGQTDFVNNPITIGTSTNPWVGNILIKDIEFDGVSSSNALTVYTTTGDITLDNVDVAQQRAGNYTALLDSDSGDINVQNHSTFDGRNTGGDTSSGFSATTATGSITITGAAGTDNLIQFRQSAGAGGTNHNGATLSAPTISLSYVYAGENDGNGLFIFGGSLVTLNGVATLDNGENGIVISNASTINLTEVYSADQNNNGNGLSGVLINGTGSTIATVYGGVFADNARYGIEIFGGQLFIATPPSCPTTGNARNTLGCYNVTPSTDLTPPVITKTVSGTTGNNGWYISDVSVDWTVSDPESPFTMVGCVDTTISSDTSNTISSCSATSAGGTSGDSVTVKRDASAPNSVTGAPSRAPDHGAWYNHAVDVTFTGSDGTSGIASCTTTNYGGPGGSGVTVSGSCTDNAGNVGTGASSAFNYDGTAPSLTLPSNITTEATSPTGAAVNYSASAVDGVDGSPSVSCSPTSGSTFGLGSTTVNCSASDAAGNSTSGSFQVTVQDTTPPALSLPANINVSTAAASVIVTYTTSASDAVDGPVPVICAPISGANFPVGSTTVNCSATDAHSNTSNGSFIVNVQNVDAPNISVPANITAEATSASGAAVSYSASATDVVDGPVAVNCSPVSGSTFPLGTTTVSCSAIDSDAHTSTAAFLVIVTDTTAPGIASPANITVMSSNASGIAVNYANPSTSDAVDGPGSASCSPVSGSVFPIGNTQVVCTAMDSHGNTAISIFIIHVDQAGTPSTPGSSNAQSGSSNSPSGLSAAVIPLTGGEVINLDCSTAFWAFEIKLSYFELCDQQTTVRQIGTGDLPAKLPAGFSFVMGLNINVLSDGQIVKNLPAGSGIEMDFPLYNQSQDKFAVLYWSDDDGDGKGEWIEVSKQISTDEISQVVSTGDDLYKLVNNSGSQVLTNQFYQTLTTHKTGVFVLVKK